jgi:hypothetical protein
MKQQIQIGKEFLVVVLFFSEAKKQYNYKRILPISRIAGTLSEFSAICNLASPLNTESVSVIGAANLVKSVKQQIIKQPACSDD